RPREARDGVVDAAAVRGVVAEADQHGQERRVAWAVHALLDGERAREVLVGRREVAARAVEAAEARLDGAERLVVAAGALEVALGAAPARGRAVEVAAGARAVGVLDLEVRAQRRIAEALDERRGLAPDALALVELAEGAGDLGQEQVDAGAREVVA